MLSSTSIDVAQIRLHENCQVEEVILKVCRYGEKPLVETRVAARPAACGETRGAGGGGGQQEVQAVPAGAQAGCCHHARPQELRSVHDEDQECARPGAGLGRPQLAAPAQQLAAAVAPGRSRGPGQVSQEPARPRREGAAGLAQADLGLGRRLRQPPRHAGALPVRQPPGGQVGH